MNSENCKIERRDILWKLSNFVNYHGGEIDSVIYEAGNPCHSIYYIKLYIHVTKTGKQALSYKLVFLKGSYSKGHTCRVCIVGNDSKVKQLPILNPRSTNFHTVEDNFIDEGSVTLRCKLTFPKESREYTDRVRDVSKKICALMEMNEFSDLVLCARSGEEFYANRFLLRQRCPKFLEYLGIKGEERVQVDISFSVLKALLQYIYSGKCNILLVPYVKEFYRLAEVCEFEEFTNEIFQVKLPATLCSDTKTINKRVCLNISVKDAVKGKVSFIKPVLLDSDRFFVEVFLKRVTTRGISIEANIRCGKTLEKPIFLNCSTSIAMDRKDLEIHPEVTLRFSPQDNEIEKHVVTFFSKKKLDEFNWLLMILDITYTKSETTCSIEDIDRQNMCFLCSESRSIFGMGLLSRDLLDLFYKHRDDDGDVKLLFEDGKLRAHRAVLASSSPKFYQMFQMDLEEMNGREVKIEGIGIECGKRLLGYIYSRVDLIDYKKDYESDLRFFEALDRFQVSHSLDKASALHVSRLTDTNVCDVLIEASCWNNEELIKEAVKYISLHRNVILGSTPWASLIGTHNELVKMILRNM